MHRRGWLHRRGIIGRIRIGMGRMRFLGRCCGGLGEMFFGGMLGWWGCFGAMELFQGKGDMSLQNRARSTEVGKRRMSQVQSRRGKSKIASTG